MQSMVRRGASSAWEQYTSCPSALGRDTVTVHPMGAVPVALEKVAEERRETE